jgi:hypothetical protein
VGRQSLGEREALDLTYVEEFLDSSSNKVLVRAELESPGWIIPGPHQRRPRRPLRAAGAVTASRWRLRGTAHLERWAANGRV